MRLVALLFAALSGSAPQEFAAYVRTEYQRWGKLARETGVRVQ